MRIGFLLAPGRYAPDYGILPGFGYLIATLQRDGSGSPEYRFATDPAELLAFRPELVCLTSVTSCFGQARQFAGQLREALPGVPIIVGGHHVSALPHRLPEEMDVGVIGEGEETLLELVRLVGPGGGWTPEVLAGVAGICWHEGDQVRVNPPRPPRRDLDTLPFPVRTAGSFAPDEANISTSRGCPFRCVYCSARRHWGPQRRFSAQYVVREMEHILAVRPEVRSLHFIDDLLIADRPRLREIARLMEARGLNRRLRLNAFVRSSLIDREMCALLAGMGFDAVRIGAESASDRVLRLMEPGGKASAASHLRAMQLAGEYGLRFGASFMVGFPGETREDLARTLSFIREHRGRMALQGLYLTTPFPGTPLWDQALACGLVSEEMDWRRLTNSLLNPDFDPEGFVYLNEHNVPRDELLARVRDSGIAAPGEFAATPEHAVRAAAARVAEVLRRIAATGATRLLVYGGGEHTRRHLADLAAGGLQIAGILDDAAPAGARLGGYPVYHPSQAPGLGAEAVLISSDRWEADIWARRAALQQAGLSVWQLYGGRHAPAAGGNGDR